MSPGIGRLQRPGIVLTYTSQLRCQWTRNGAVCTSFFQLMLTRPLLLRSQFVDIQALLCPSLDVSQSPAWVATPRTLAPGLAPAPVTGNKWRKAVVSSLAMERHLSSDPRSVAGLCLCFGRRGPTGLRLALRRRRQTSGRFERAALAKCSDMYDRLHPFALKASASCVHMRCVIFCSCLSRHEWRHPEKEDRPAVFLCTLFLARPRGNQHLEGFLSLPHLICFTI